MSSLPARAAERSEQGQARAAPSVARCSAAAASSPRRSASAARTHESTCVCCTAALRFARLRCAAPGSTVLLRAGGSVPHLSGRARLVELRGTHHVVPRRHVLHGVAVSRVLRAQQVDPQRLRRTNDTRTSSIARGRLAAGRAAPHQCAHDEGHIDPHAVAGHVQPHARVVSVARRKRLRVPVSSGAGALARRRGSPGSAGRVRWPARSRWRAAAASPAPRGSPSPVRPRTRASEPVRCGLGAACCCCVRRRSHLAATLVGLQSAACRQRRAGPRWAGGAATWYRYRRRMAACASSSSSTGMTMMRCARARGRVGARARGRVAGAAHREVGFEREGQRVPHERRANVCARLGQPRAPARPPCAAGPLTEAQQPVVAGGHARDLRMAPHERAIAHGGPQRGLTQTTVPA
jgi:hypothetical protein